MAAKLEMRLRAVPLSGLDLSNRARFRFRFVLPGEAGSDESDGEMARSVADAGLIAPPVLLDSDGSLEIVSGFRRAAAAGVSGIGEIPALVMQAGTDTALTVWLESALHGRPLSEMEKLILARKASGLAAGDIDEHLPLLSSVFGRRITAEMAAILAGLASIDRDVQEALHLGRISPGDILQLEDHPGIDAAAAARLLAGSGLSRSARREAVRGILAMADHDPGVFSRFIPAWDPDEVPLDEAIRKVTHPNMDGDIAFLRRVTADMDLPPGTSVRFPDNLEGGYFTVEIKVRDEETFQVSLQHLGESLEDGLVKGMLDVLKGRS
jgi:ParB-like chromosome segregation protein Spo0J